MRTKTYLSLIILYLSSSFLMAADTLDLMAAKKLKGITLTVEGLGGHSEYCVSISLTNSTSKPIHLIVSPGTLMKPENEGLQDLLVVEKKHYDLLPNKAIYSRLRAFCAAHSKGSPTRKSKFNVTMGDSNLIKLATYIDKNPKVSDIQSAVWVVANGTPISSINKDNKDLLKIVSVLASQPIADYTVVFANSADALFSNKAARVQGDIEYTVRGEDLVSFQIYDDKNRLRKTIYTGRLTKRGVHKVDYDIDVSKLNKGVYFIKVHQQNQLISQKKFEI